MRLGFGLHNLFHEGAHQLLLGVDRGRWRLHEQTRLGRVPHDVSVIAGSLLQLCLVVDGGVMIDSLSYKLLGLTGSSPFGVVQFLEALYVEV